LGRTSLGFEQSDFDNFVIKDGDSATLFAQDFSEDRGIFAHSNISYKTDETRGGYIYVDGTGLTNPLLFAPLVSGVGSSLPMMRKGFDTPADKTVKSARLYATAFGLYDAFVNGAAVAPDEMFNPGWTDYRTVLMYQTYDVTHLIQPGKNALAAQLGDGWFAGHVGYSHTGNGGDNANKYGQYPAFLGQLEITYTDGAVQTIATDGSWKVNGNGPYLATDNHDGETYDARREIPGWSTAAFDDAGWPNVGVVNSANAADLLGKTTSRSYSGFAGAVVDVDNVRLISQIGPRIRMGQALSAEEEALLGKEIRDVTVIDTFADGRVILDCGQNVAGVITITIRGGQAGDQIRLRYAEMVNDGVNNQPVNELYTAALRSAKATDYYTKKGSGIEVYTPRFTWHGFRYIEVQGYPGTLDPDDITVYFVGSEISLTGTVESSSADLNQFYSNVMWSQKGNFFSIPSDCPQRDERLGWMDVHAFSLTAAYNRNVEEFFNKFVHDMMSRQRPDGGMWDYLPDEGHDHYFGNAGWADAATIVPWNIYVMYGDKKILEEAYSMMQGHLYYHMMAASSATGSDYAWNQGATYAAFDKANPPQPPITDLGTTADDRKYILGGCAYGDWVPVVSTPNEIFATAYYARSADIVANAAAVLGKTEDAAYYRALADRIKLSFQRRFYDASTGIISSGARGGDTQTCYALAIAFDLLPAGESPKLSARLGQLVESAGYMTTGMQGSRVLLPALSEAGHSELAYYLLIGVDTYPSWLYSIRQGATTIWERWNSYTKESGFGPVGMNSFNHFAFGAGLEWVYRCAAGIEADESAPGFKHAILQPMPNNRLTFLNTSFDSAYGRIVSDWTYDGPTGAFDYTAKVPGNTAATVYVPAADAADITVNGAGVNGALPAGVTYLGHDAQAKQAVFAVGSGTYRFTSRIKADKPMKPALVESPESGTYLLGADANLRVSVAVNDGGTLSYQWFRSSAKSAENSTPVGTDSAVYAAPTALPGMSFYYVTVTNTLNGQSVSVTSGVAGVNVVTPVTGKPQPGSYAVAQNVTLSSLIEGAEIYYTTDGTEPTTASARFTAPIPVSQNTTIRAIAVKGEEIGDITDLKYIIDAGLLLFFDDFSDGLGQWTTTARATIVDGWLRLTNNENMRSAVGDDWTNYMLEADVKVENACAGLTFRWQSTGSQYMWNFSSSGYMRRHTKINNSFSAFTDIPFGIENAGDAFHVKLVIDGNTISSYVNDELLDVMTLSNFSSGRIGFRQSGAEVGLFDNIVVTKIVDTAEVTPDSKDFGRLPEDYAAADLTPQTFTFAYNGSGALKTLSAALDADSDFALAGTLTQSGNMGAVSVVPKAGLAAGDHTGALTFTFNGQTISVPLSVRVGFAAAVTPDGSDYIVEMESGADVTAAVIAAVYDAAGRLADVKTARDAFVGANAPPVIKTFEGLTIPDGGSVKFYFWDNGTYAPLCPPQ
jgi:alpha-L-rhamnosidase